jgi:hypothetical protein
MTSKEALEKISWRYVNEPSFQKWCNTVKQDLDQLEELKIENQDLKDNEKIITDYGYNLVIENEKLKKAIEIMKNKKMSVTFFRACKDIKEVNSYRNNENQLTKEEYELLKEVLED